MDYEILNSELWGFKTEVLERALSDHSGWTLQSDQESLPDKKFKHNKHIHKYVWVANKENIKHLNY